MRSKSNPQLFVTVKRSPQKTHDRSRKDSQQKQSLVVRYSLAITAKGFAAKIVNCSTGDHCKILTREAVMIHTQQITQSDSKRGIAINTLESTFLSMLLVLFPVDCDTHKIFCRLPSNVFVSNQSRGTLMHHTRTLFVCHCRSISGMAAVYHLKIKHENQ